VWDVCNELDRYVSETRKTPGQKKSLWQGVSGGRGGVSLGYRKASRGAGAWIVKIALDGVRCEERLGAASDDDATPGGLSYPSAVTAALTWGRQQCEIIDAGKEAGAVARIPTVRSSVRQYIDFRQRRSPVAGANAKSRLTRHVLSDQKFADTKLSRLRTFDFDGWRERLPETLAQATVNRLLNDLRAALNLAVEKHRRELPAATALEIKIGTKAGAVLTNARRLLLTDEQVRDAVRAAFAVDPDGDFGYVVLILAASGARYSQAAALKVDDVQKERGRIMMPPSRKGRSQKKKAPTPVPVDRGVLMSLAPLVKGRVQDQPLLRRWSYKRAGRLKWVRTHPRPLGSACEAEKQWAEVVGLAKLPKGTVMYSLRHSAIVRCLRQNLPVRLVAALHDTSIEMIEAHYSAHIVDMTEELSRRTAISFARPMLQAAE
jgi:integrase